MKRARGGIESSDGEEMLSQNIVFVGCGNVRWTLDAPLVTPSGSTNDVVFPGLHFFTSPTADGERRAVTDHYDQNIEYYEVGDDIGKLPSGAMIETGATGCTTHGPFRCTCKYLTLVSRSMLQLAHEFQIFDFRTNPLPPLIAFVGVDEFQAAQQGEFRQAREFYLSRIADGSDVASCGGLMLFCMELRLAAAVFVDSALPLQRSRLFFGPFKFQQADTEQSIIRSVQLGSTLVCGATSDRSFPKCFSCGVMDASLQRCGCCAKLTCGGCASTCSHCVGRKVVCVNCVVSVRQNGSSEELRLCTHCLYRLRPDLAECQQ